MIVAPDFFKTGILFGSKTTWSPFFQYKMSNLDLFYIQPSVSQIHLNI